MCLAGASKLSESTELKGKQVARLRSIKLAIQLEETAIQQKGIGQEDVTISSIYVLSVIEDTSVKLHHQSNRINKYLENIPSNRNRIHILLHSSCHQLLKQTTF